MARPKNLQKSRKFDLYFSAEVRGDLDKMLMAGLHGETINSIASRLIQDFLSDERGNIRQNINLQRTQSASSDGKFKIEITINETAAAAVENAAKDNEMSVADAAEEMVVGQLRKIELKKTASPTEELTR